VNGVLLAPFAELLELDFALDLLLILPGIIVGPFAGLAD
jgi:hypothetical protein